MFICRSNAGRSQTAEAFFRKSTNKHTAESAGIGVSNTGTVGLPPGKDIVEVLKDYYKIDISKRKRKQVNGKMLEEADKIIVLMGEPERKRYLPQYFKKFGNKTVFWDVVDMRHTKSVDALRKRTAKIKGMVEALVKELG